ncbi:hypothetical protein COO60DRAFT_1519912 [Scenedesmus sp. NREL 46B-D3]|nr:hypothetical protein COO60DRAFT_1519912 [Scenedesmus sp. NREL 46B-D3]
MAAVSMPCTAAVMLSEPAIPYVFSTRISSRRRSSSRSIALLLTTRIGRNCSLPANSALSRFQICATHVLAVCIAPPASTSNRKLRSQRDRCITGSISNTGRTPASWRTHLVAGASAATREGCRWGNRQQGGRHSHHQQQHQQAALHPDRPQQPQQSRHSALAWSWKFLQ